MIIIVSSNRDGGWPVRRGMPLSVRVEVTRAPPSAAISPAMNSRLVVNLPVRGYWALVLVP